MSQITRIDVVPSSQREEAPPVDGRTSVASVTGVYEDVIVDREKAMDALSIDDELAATMPSTEALDHFDSQWHSYGTHMSPLHFAASLGKRRYLSLLLKQLHHSNLSERNLARLEHLRQRGQTHGLNMLAVTGRYSTQSNFLCAYIHTGNGGRAHLFMITHSIRDSNSVPLASIFNRLASESVLSLKHELSVPSLAHVFHHVPLSLLSVSAFFHLNRY